MDELTLVKKCIQGDSVAQRTLFERFAPKMMSVSLRYTKTTEASEDVLQIGFVKVFAKLKNFEGKGSLEGWIRRIIVNTALDTIRQNSKYRNDVEIGDVEYYLEDSSANWDLLQAEDLMKLVMSLPDGYRIVFNLFAIEGYSHKEIAEQLGISENTSKSQYSRARNYLRIKLEELEIKEFEGNR